MCLTFQEIPRNILSKILCSQYGSSFNFLYQRKLLTNYQVCILNIRKRFCNYHIVPCIEKHSRYFVGKSCIHVPLLHMLQMLQHYIANYVTLRTRQHLLHSLLSGTFKKKSIVKWKKMASFYCILFRYEILLKVSFMDIICTTMQ